MEQVLHRDLAVLCKKGLFNFEVGAKEPRRASAKVLNFLPQHFRALSHDTCLTSSAAKTHPAGTCSKLVVLLGGSTTSGVLQAGEVWLQDDCDGVCLTRLLSIAPLRHGLFHIRIVVDDFVQGPSQPLSHQDRGR